MATWKFKTGDTWPPYRSTLTDAAGAPVDLTDATVRFVLKAADAGPDDLPIIEGDETGPGGGPLDDTGQVEYAWAYTETDALAGHYRAEHVVTFPGGTVRRFPTVGWDRVYFYPALDPAPSS